MHNRRLVVCGAGVALALLCSGATAKDKPLGEWLSPAKKGPEKSTSARKPGKQMLLGKPVNRSPKKKNGFVSTVSSGPKKLFGQMKNLVPGKKAPEKPSEPMTGKRLSKNHATRTEKKKGSLFENWFGPKESEPPRSVGEWMKLPRNDI